MSIPEDSTIREDTGRRHAGKYSNPNPIQRLVLDRFFHVVAEEVRAIAPRRTLDFGTGEGFLLERLERLGVRFPSLLGVDLRDDALAEARRRCPGYDFRHQDLLAWEPAPEPFDLTIASEVLEHLPQPERFLECLAGMTCGHLLLTVPWEPWFSLMNLLRGRDLMRLGNHPEHVNQWTGRSFRRLVEPYVEIERFRTVFPFLIVVARPRAARRNGQP